MEWCEMGSLDDLLKSQHPIPLHRQYLARIICGIATALHFLHKQNIFHGSVYIDNILIDHNMVGRLAGLSTCQMISQNTIIKPYRICSYRAPETYGEKIQAFPQDMFAVGVILYRCLIGYLPNRKKNGEVDYHGLKSSLHIPLDSEMWYTTQLLLSNKLDFRPTAGQLLYTDWIIRSKTERIKRIFNWNFE
ncbi:unnamed protein product [Dracunculus medinensis]|uniref:Protein kinase domain-containing protein n=1 Tax=Dracunculus medinensis TaxID=318479 RepID=A0A0N4U3C1_DRAME|nr:unnamed protein product [Dracunculus medinensis]